MDVPLFDATDIFDNRCVSEHSLDEELGRVLQQVGSCALRLPGPCAETPTLVRAMLRFFDLSAAQRMAVAKRSVRPDASNQWFGYGYQEEAGQVLNETYDISGGRQADSSIAFDASELLFEATPWPSEMPTDWREAVSQCHTTLSEIGVAMVRLIARYLHRDEEGVVDRFRNHNSSLRLLNYPVVDTGSTTTYRRSGEVHESFVRGRAHEDSGVLTFIWQNDRGLQTLDRQGRWRNVSPSSWSVHCGVMMGMMTNGAIPATTHRVVGGTRSRRSVALFFEPAVEASILPWSPVGAPEEEVLSASSRYGPWLLKRHGYPLRHDSVTRGSKETLASPAASNNEAAPAAEAGSMKPRQGGT